MFASLAWLLSLMIAPHSLALHGNLAGAWGHLLPLGLMAAAGTYLLFEHLVGENLSCEDCPEPPSPGVLLFLALPLAAHLLTAIAGATGMLVTAGFAFNETFFYWFPNFAFAFLLLGLVVLIHFGGHRWVQSAQMLFSMVALGGLLLLTIVALARSGSGSTAVSGAGLDFSTHSWALVLLLFVGVDLARLNPSANAQETRRAIYVGVLAAALLYVLWGWAAVKQVAPQRLADTTIAPVLVAKQAWGQWGRAVMGIVTIAGTLAAVNALFAIVTATINRTYIVIGREHSLRFRPPPPAAIAALLGIAIAAAMAQGMAGTEAIDVALRAGLLLWLLHYALSPLLIQAHAPEHGRRSKWPLAFLCGGLMLAGAGLIVFADPERDLTLTFMLAGIAAAILATGGFWGWVNLGKGV